MKFIENWYSSIDIARLYSIQRDKKLIVLPNDFKSNLYNPIFLQYDFNNTTNFLPVNAYASFVLNSNTILSEALVKYIRFFQKYDLTSVFLPTISYSNPKNFLSQELLDLYCERMDSYTINLLEDLITLKRNISKRKRGETNADKLMSKFFVSSRKKKQIFVDLYYKFMNTLKVSDFNIIKPDVLEEFINQENTLVFHMEINNKVELMHLVGLDPSSKNAEFVLSASSDKGYSLGYAMIWNEINYLKSIGYSKFNLGGGINKGDGVSTFKKRVGGQTIYNGGIKLVINQEKYNYQLSKFQQGGDHKSFFPSYLRDEVFLKIK